MNLKEELDYFRRVARVKSIIFVGGILLLIATALLLFEHAVVLILCFVGIFVLSVLLDKDKDIIFYKKFYKKYHYQRIFSDYFEEIDYQTDKEIPQELFERTGAFVIGVHLTTSDYLKAKWKGKKFSSVLVDSRTYAGKNETVYFSGLYCVTNLNFEANGYTYVRRKTIFGVPKPAKNLVKCVKCYSGNEQFDKDFIIYSNEPAKVSELLGETLLEAMTVITNGFDCDVTFAFVKDRLYVLFNNGINASNPRIFLEDKENFDDLKKKRIKPIIAVLKYFDSVIQ